MLKLRPAYLRYVQERNRRGERYYDGGYRRRAQTQASRSSKVDGIPSTKQPTVCTRREPNGKPALNLRGLIFTL